MSKKKQRSPEECVAILRKAEGFNGTHEEFCRAEGISTQSFYRWKKKYGGMEASEAKRLKELERENARLKKLVAERALEIDVMKEILAKKW